MISNMREEKQKSRGILRIVIASVLFFVLVLIVTSMFWCMGVWHDITVDEILFHLNAPIEGTAENVMTGFYLKALLPAVLITAVFTAILAALRKRPKPRKAFKIGSWATAGIAFVLALVLFCNQYGVIGYISSQLSASDFISRNYVDPGSVAINFPEQKRNLIYIYLESMEDTYADTGSGGAFDENVIPELTMLALENECFAGDSGFLDGGYVTTGTTYTMAALLAQTSGIPMNSNGSIGNAASSYADSFYPGATVLGDILAKEGYNQMFMCGSVAYFGGRELYFEGHGGYKVFDYKYAELNDYIPKGYKVWWGYEDSKLFDFAKEQILEMASDDAPFNFTMLTADTHFEDGYLCDLCGSAYGDQYSNVMACSSSQVYEFVEWAKQQDFYENTTIIISGDHTTMDSDYCENLPSDYVRKTYVCVINPACECETSDRREYTTLDMFPTTLAALGCEIEGDRLGLGTNLFSSKPTLLEEYGAEFLDSELAKKTDFYETIGSFDNLTSDIMKHLRYIDLKTELTDSGELKVEFWGIENAGLEIASARGEFYSGDVLVASCDFALQQDKTYTGSLDLSSLSFRDVYTGTMKIFATDTDGVEHVAFVNDDNISVISCDDLGSYLEMLAGLEDVTVMVGVKDEASTNLTAADCEILCALGCEDAGVIFPGGVNHRGIRIGRVAGADGKLARVKLEKDLGNGDGLAVRGEREETGLVYAGPDTRAGETALLRLRPGVKVKAGDEVFRLTDAEQVRAAEALKGRTVPADLYLRAMPGEPLTLTATDGESWVTVTGETVEAAEKRAATAEELARNLEKTGDTVFVPRETRIETEGAFVPVSRVNAIRREALEKLAEARIQAFEPDTDGDGEFPRENLPVSEVPPMAYVRTAEQAEAARAEGLRVVFCPEDYRAEALERLKAEIKAGAAGRVRGGDPAGAAALDRREPGPAGRRRAGLCGTAGSGLAGALRRGTRDPGDEPAGGEPAV